MVSMKFIKGLNITEVTLRDGKIITFNCSQWNRSGASLTPEMFDIINDYWALQSKEWLSELESIYLEAEARLNSLNGYRGLKEPFTDLVTRLITMHPWDQLHEWVINKGNCNLEIGAKEEMGDKDRSDLTYWTDDYNDVLVLAVLLKPVLPLWGAYTKAIASEIDKVNINIKCLELLRDSYILHSPAYVKLVNYTINLSKDKINIIGFSIVSEIGTDDITDLLVSLCLIKKIVIFNPRADGYSIVTNIFKLLQDKCKSLNYIKPGKKLDTGDDGSDMTISDTYRIVQPIPPAVAVTIEHFLRDPYTVANLIDSSVTKTAIRVANSRIDKNGEITTIHVMVTAIVLASAVSPPMLRLIDHTSMTNAVIASSALLQTWGFTALSELMVTTPTEQDMFSVSLTSTAGKILKEPTKEEYTRLAENYVFLGTVSPGEQMINDIGRLVATRDWQLPSGNIDLVKIELFELLMKITK